MYALDLAMGHTLHCKTIKSETIKSYLKAAADHISEARRRTLSNTITQHPIWSDPRIDLATGKTSKLISNITDEVRCWEKMPNQREPLTVDMIQRAALQCNGATPHGIHNVMYDWSIIAIYIGPRLAEWAQHDNGKIIMNKFSNVRAFTWDDVEFRGENNR